MNCKKGHKEPKHIAYGQTKGRYWCIKCDRELVPSLYKSIKKQARQKSKKFIKKELKDS